MNARFEDWGRARDEFLPLFRRLYKKIRDIPSPLWGTCAFADSGLERRHFLRPLRGLGRGGDSFPRACAWGYRLAPATRAWSWGRDSFPRLAPGATVLRPQSGLGRGVAILSPGLRLGLPSHARYAGWVVGAILFPGLRLGLPSCARYAGWVVEVASFPQAYAWGLPSNARYAGSQGISL